MQKSDYFRRCHVCGAVSHKADNHDISRCSHCGKAWAPFQYFDDRLVPTHSDRHYRAQFSEGEWQPIQGLTVYWESF